MSKLRMMYGGPFTRPRKQEVGKVDPAKEVPLEPEAMRRACLEETAETRECPDCEKAKAELLSYIEESGNLLNRERKRLELDRKEALAELHEFRAQAEHRLEELEALRKQVEGERDEARALARVEHKARNAQMLELAQVEAKLEREIARQAPKTVWLRHVEPLGWIGGEPILEYRVTEPTGDFPWMKAHVASDKPAPREDKEWEARGFQKIPDMPPDPFDAAGLAYLATQLPQVPPTFYFEPPAYSSSARCVMLPSVPCQYCDGTVREEGPFMRSSPIVYRCDKCGRTPAAETMEAEADPKEPDAMPTLVLPDMPCAKCGCDRVVTSVPLARGQHEVAWVCATCGDEVGQGSSLVGTLCPHCEVGRIKSEEIPQMQEGGDSSKPRKPMPDRMRLVCGDCGWWVPFG